MTKPYLHQEEIINRFKDKEFGAIFAEPGTGKTLPAIKITEHKYLKEEISGAIVVTTKGLMLNWADVELIKHSEILYKAFVWSRDELKPANCLIYYIINIDALLTDRFIPFVKSFLKLHPKFALIVDESTFAKNRNAKRTKFLLRLASYAKCRFIMTGTPVVNTPLDLWSQCEILEPQILGYKNFFAFRADFTVMKTMKFGFRSFQKVVDYKNLDELTRILRQFSIMVKARDCLDLPPRRYRRVKHDFTTEQKKAYEDLRTTALAYIQNNAVTAVNAISLINRLMQICSGQIKLPDGTYLSIQNYRLPLLTELVEESNKVIIWTAFVNNAREIAESLGDQIIWLQSGQTITQRQVTLDEFRQTNKKGLVANPASAGHGITLVEADTVIYYSRSFNWEHRVQSMFRTDRIGQTKSVLYTDLYIPGTVEEKVLDLYDSKEEVATEVLKGLDNPAKFIKDMIT